MPVEVPLPAREEKDSHVSETLGFDGSGGLQGLAVSTRDHIGRTAQSLLDQWNASILRLGRLGPVF